MKICYLTTIFLICLIGLFLAPRPSQAQENDGQAYIIQLNDTLWKLAEKYLDDGNSYPAIVAATATQANLDSSFTAITDPNLLQPGQKIWIPTTANIVTTTAESTVSGQDTSPAPLQIGNNPTGQIAFSFWNNSPSRCTYEVNIVSVPDCLQSAGQCQATRRIVPLNNISQPALSPNGALLAFRSWGSPPDNGPFADCAQAHPYRQLGRSTLNGTEYVSLSNFWEDSHPDWSADGNRILFDSGRDSDDIIRIYATSPDGMREEDLRIAGQFPSWAPDNQRFVYRGCDLTGNRCGLWLANATEVPSWDAGKNMIGPVLEDPQATHPDWSAVSGEIVYQSPAGGSWDLYLINADGTGQRQLTTGPGLEGLPRWSPDGQWIAYVSFDGQNWSLRIVSADGSDDRLLFTYDGGIYALPAATEPYGVRDWLDEQISWSQ
jgi:TolB protein